MPTTGRSRRTLNKHQRKQTLDKVMKQPQGRNHSLANNVGSYNVERRCASQLEESGIIHERGRQFETTKGYSVEHGQYAMSRHDSQEIVREGHLQQKVGYKAPISSYFQDVLTANQYTVDSMHPMTQDFRGQRRFSQPEIKSHFNLESGPAYSQSDYSQEDQSPFGRHDLQPQSILEQIDPTLSQNPSRISQFNLYTPV